MPPTSPKTPQEACVTLQEWFPKKLNDGDKQVFYILAKKVNVLWPRDQAWVDAQWNYMPEDIEQEEEEDEGSELDPLEEAEENLKQAKELGEDTLVEYCKKEVEQLKAQASDVREEEPNAPGGAQNRRWWESYDTKSPDFWTSLINEWYHDKELNQNKASGEIDCYWQQLILRMIEYTHGLPNWKRYCGELTWFVRDLWEDTIKPDYDPKYMPLADVEAILEDFTAYVHAHTIGDANTDEGETPVSNTTHITEDSAGSLLTQHTTRLGTGTGAYTGEQPSIVGHTAGTVPGSVQTTFSDTSVVGQSYNSEQPHPSGEDGTLANKQSARGTNGSPSSLQSQDDK